VGVVVAVVALAAGLVDSNVGGDPVPLGQLPGKPYRQFPPLPPGQFGRQRDLHLSGDYRVLSLVVLLRSVLKLGVEQKQFP
jgi:hypothetical protein